MNLLAIIAFFISTLPNPLIVRDPVAFDQNVSVQVDFAPIGSTVILETCNDGIWQEASTITNITSPSVVFCLPLATNLIFRAGWKP
jgi:hypothetical protein